MNNTVYTIILCYTVYTNISKNLVNKMHHALLLESLTSCVIVPQASHQKTVE